MTLRHRDTEVLRFDWLEPQGVRIVSVNEAATRFLPLDFHGEATDANLWNWLKHRVVPIRRHAHYNLPTERLRILEDFLQKRISEIVEYDEENNENNPIAQCGCTVKDKNRHASCTVNGQTSEAFANQLKQNLKADPFITKEELAEILQVSPRTVATYLKKLQEARRVRRVGPPKTGHWEVV